MGKKRNYAAVIIGILFALSLYFVEAGVAGSSVVAQYNHGYGTFDMKQYDAQIVRAVLSEMSDKGITVYRWYYFWDFIFIIFFGLVQGLLAQWCFRWNKNHKAVRLLWVIPIARGVFDSIENALLLITISIYPNINESIISIASVATNCKLWMIRLWVVELIVGIVFGTIKRKKLRVKASE